MVGLPVEVALVFAAVNGGATEGEDLLLADASSPGGPVTPECVVNNC